MLFDAKTTVADSIPADESPVVTLAFDWETERYVMTDGTPVELSGIDGAKQWLEQCLRTIRGKYGIYPINYGCSALELRGKKLHNGTALPELESELKQAIHYCDEVQDIGNVRLEGKTIMIDCIMQDGTVEVVGIEGD